MIPPLPTSAAPPPRPDPLRTVAAELETVFLAEMLRNAGLGSGGGLGDSDAAGQFDSFICTAQAGAMVAAGGIGLTESLFRALAGGSADV